MEEIHLLVEDKSLSKNAIAFHVPVEIIPPRLETDNTGKFLDNAVEHNYVSRDLYT